MRNADGRYADELNFVLENGFIRDSLQTPGLNVRACFCHVCSLGDRWGERYTRYRRC